MKYTFIYTIVLHCRLCFFLSNLSKVFFLSMKTYFLHCKSSYRLSTFQYGASAWVTVSLLFLQVRVCPKNLWICQWLFGSKHRLNIVSNLDIRYGEICIKQYYTMTYLGCLLDEALSRESIHGFNSYNQRQ